MKVVLLVALFILCQVQPGLSKVSKVRCRGEQYSNCQDYCKWNCRRVRNCISECRRGCGCRQAKVRTGVYLECVQLLECNRNPEIIASENPSHLPGLPPEHFKLLKESGLLEMKYKKYLK